MEISPDQGRAFVGPRADYYVDRWTRIGLGTTRAGGFNFPTFFFSVVWLLYRRMYTWFWIALGLLAISVLLEELALAAAGVEEVPVLTSLINIGVAATFGTFGTYWYYRHAVRKVRRLALSAEPDLAAIARAGGTSWWAPTVFLVVFFGLIVLAAWVDNQATLAP